MEYPVVLGSDSGDHLYRGVKSPSPIGVVVVLTQAPQNGTMSTICIEFPWGEVLRARAVVHWSTEAEASTFRVGLRLVNPSLSVTLALSRAATMYPTRLFDEHCCDDGPAANDYATDFCPPTARNPREMLVMPKPPASCASLWHRPSEDRIPLGPHS